MTEGFNTRMRRKLEHITWADHEQDGADDYSSIGTDSLRHTFMVIRQENVPPAHRYLVAVQPSGNSTTAPTLAKAKRAAKDLRR